MMAAEPFRWRDGERLICFGRASRLLVEELVEPGWTLLGTSRSIGQVPELVQSADDVKLVPSGSVEMASAELAGTVSTKALVAVGGGKVIDVAKALAAAAPPCRVVAIPTTLSGAEMTAFHRHTHGVPAETARVRPAIVLNDPELLASDSTELLMGSAANALAHAVEATVTVERNPVSDLAAAEGVRRILAGLYATDDLQLDERAPCYSQLGLGALLCGYAVGSSGFGLHHVLAQAVASTGFGHGPANAALLPHTIPALRLRCPEGVGLIESAIGMNLVTLASAIARDSGTPRLRTLGAGVIDDAVDAALSRPQLEITPPRATREEIEEIYRAAW